MVYYYLFCLFFSIENIDKYLQGFNNKVRNFMDFVLHLYKKHYTLCQKKKLSKNLLF